MIEKCFVDQPKFDRVKANLFLYILSELNNIEQEHQYV
jgi:hypothetical protein